VIYLLYIDRAHQADPIFWKGLGRAIATAKGLRAIVVHGGGDRVEQRFEAEGLPYARGSEARDPRHAAELVERTLREENHRIVSALTELMVPAVGLHGIDRGLLTEDVSGTMTSRGAHRVGELTLQGAFPVISTLVSGPVGYPREGAVHRAVVALYREMENNVISVVVFGNKGRPGIAKKGAWRERIEWKELMSIGVLPDSTEVGLILAEGLPVFLTSAVGLVTEPTAIGTWINPRQL